jgi:hypothetical protein
MPEGNTNLQPPEVRTGVIDDSVLDRLKAHYRQELEPAPEDKDETETETEEEVETETEETEVVEEEVEEEATDESEETTETEVEEDEEDEEIDLLDHKIIAKVNGEDLEITVKEAAEGYQRLEDYTRKTQEIAAQKVEVAETIEKYRQGLNLIGQYFMAELKPYQDFDWEGLKAEDPQAYAVKKIEASEAVSRVEEIQRQLAQASQEQQHYTADQAKELAAQEGAKMAEVFGDDWTDETKRAATQRAWGEYGISQGYQVDELRGVIDHRFLVLLDKARKYDELQDKVQVVHKKKVVKAPKKITKTKQPKESPEEQSYKKSVEEFNEGQSVDSLQNLLKHRLKPLNR